MFRSKSHGFSLYEFMFALILAGILAGMLIPQVITGNDNLRTKSVIVDSFNTIGDLYLARKNSSEYVPDNSASEPESLVDGDENLADGNENVRFANYLLQYLNYSSTTFNGSVSSATLCSTPADYFVFSMGVRIRSICDVTTTTPKRLEVLVEVPKRNSTNRSYTIIIPEEASGSGKSEERYTTKFAYTAVNSDCRYADVVLKTTTSCTIAANNDL